MNEQNKQNEKNEKIPTFGEFLAQHADDFPEYEDDNGEESLVAGLKLYNEYRRLYGEIK